MIGNKNVTAVIMAIVSVITWINIKSTHRGFLLGAYTKEYYVTAAIITTAFTLATVFFIVYYIMGRRSPY